MNQPVIELHHLNKKIGRQSIINDLSLTIYKGEVFGFLGPNGAGKTTTIRMMVGLMRPTAGHITIMGHNLCKDFEQAIRHIGTIVENPELYTYLTGYQNLVQFSRMTGRVDESRIREVVALVGLEDRIKHKVKTYSLGMKQRLGVAQALLHHPSLLILDEPTNGLDPAGIREFRHLIQKLAHEEGVAVFVSSHLLSEIELMCDRVAVIQKGQLIGIEKVADFVQDAKQLTVRFTVDAVDKVKALSLPVDPIFTRGTSRFTVNLEFEDIPNWVERLTKEGVKIYSVEPLTQTLEERFLELTGGLSV